MQNKLKFVFSLFAMVFISVSFTGAYFSDNVTTSGNTFTAGTWEVSSAVINEIYSNPLTGEIEWIELLNKQTTALDLAGYTIEDGTGAQKNLDGYSIPANGYLVLSKGVDFSFGLNNPGDIVVLRKSGGIKDQVSYGNWNDGNMSDNAPAPVPGQSICRIPNGADSDDDSADFQIRAHPSITPGAPNV